MSYCRHQDHRVGTTPRLAPLSGQQVTLDGPSYRPAPARSGDTPPQPDRREVGTGPHRHFPLTAQGQLPGRQRLTVPPRAQPRPCRPPSAEERRTEPETCGLLTRYRKHRTPHRSSALAIGTGLRRHPARGALGNVVLVLKLSVEWLRDEDYNSQNASGGPSAQALSQREKPEEEVIGVSWWRCGRERGAKG